MPHLSESRKVHRVHILFIRPAVAGAGEVEEGGIGVHVRRAHGVHVAFAEPVGCVIPVEFVGFGDVEVGERAEDVELVARPERDAEGHVGVRGIDEGDHGDVEAVGGAAVVGGGGHVCGVAGPTLSRRRRRHPPYLPHLNLTIPFILFTNPPNQVRSGASSNSLAKSS